MTHVSPEQLDQLLDGELPRAEAQTLDQHIAACAACGARREERRRLVATIRAGLPRLAASDTLHARVTQRGARLRATPWLVAAIAASLAVGALGGWQLGLRRGGAARLADQVLASHVRALMPGHLTDVASSDEHTVKPWFNGRLDYSPPVSDFAGAGYPLLGGRLDYVDGRPVAALVYGRRQHLIDVFVWPASAAGGGAEETRQGYHLLHWTSGGFSYWMASDLGVAELRTMAQLIRQSDSAAAPAAR